MFERTIRSPGTPSASSRSSPGAAPPPRASTRARTHAPVSQRRGRGRAQHALLDRRHGVPGADEPQHAGAEAAARELRRQAGDEVLGQGVDRQLLQPGRQGPAEVGADAGDHVHARRAGDLREGGARPAEAPHGRVHDGAEPGGPGERQLACGQVRVVERRAGDERRQVAHEVLVHRHGAQRGRVDRPEDRLYDHAQRRVVFDGSREAMVTRRTAPASKSMTCADGP